jgi:dTDP-4-dehydrorhamnose reductase
MDVADAGAVFRRVADFRPEVVIHTAAYTDTTGCEANPDLAYTVNALGTRNVCLACRQVGAAILYISTNEVFDGAKASPYLEFDEPNPLNFYAKSKLAGERYVQTLMDRFWIVRAAWLYARGGNNFIAKIVRAAREKGNLSVVTDEVATPTWARDLALALSQLVQHPLYGTYHFTNAGHCSRFEWAEKTLELLDMKGIIIKPTTLGDYGSPYVKPQFSALRNFVGQSLGIVLRPWDEALKDYLGREGLE